MPQTSKKLKIRVKSLILSTLKGKPVVSNHELLNEILFGMKLVSSRGPPTNRL